MKTLKPIRLRELGVSQSDILTKKALKFIVGGYGGDDCPSGIWCRVWDANGEEVGEASCCRLTSVSDCEKAGEQGYPLASKIECK